MKKRQRCETNNMQNSTEPVTKGGFRDQSLQLEPLIYGRERAWLPRTVGNVMPVLCETRVAASDRVNGRDVVRQGYHRPHVTATAVRCSSFLNAPTSLHSAQRQHYADCHVTSQLASDNRGKGPLASGTAPVINRATRHEGMWVNSGTAPYIRDRVIRWR